MSLTYYTDLERRQAEELRIMRIAMWAIATIEANANSEPNTMAAALELIIATAQGALRQANDAQSAVVPA